MVIDRGYLGKVSGASVHGLLTATGAGTKDLGRVRLAPHPTNATHDAICSARHAHRALLTLRGFAVAAAFAPVKRNTPTLILAHGKYGQAVQLTLESLHLYQRRQHYPRIY